MLYNFCMIMFLLANIKKNKFEDQYHLLHTVCCLLIKFVGRTIEQQENCPSAIRLLSAHNTTSRMTKQKSFLFFFEVAFDCQNTGGQL